MPTITINAKEIIKGASLNDFLNNGGFSPIDRGANIELEEGLIYPQPAFTNKGDLNGTKIVAWAETEGSSGTNTVAVDDSGKFYQIGSSGEKYEKNTDTSNVYTDMKSDMVYYAGYFYATCEDGVVRLSADLLTIDKFWWTTTEGKAALDNGVPHQLLVFDSKLYIISANTVYCYDYYTTTHTTYTVVGTGDKITAIGEYQNTIYLATEPYYNAFGLYHGKGALYVWDGSSDFPSNKYPISERISTFKVYNGYLYAFSTSALNRWNGISFEPIYKLYDNVYKQQITEYDKKLFFADFNNTNSGIYTSDSPTQHAICCFNGERFSYPMQYVDKSSPGYEYAQAIDAIFCNYEDRFIVSSNSDLLYTTLDNVSGDGFVRFNRIDFSDNVKIKRIYFVTSEALSSSEIVLTFYNHLGASKTIGTATTGRINEFNNINIDTFSFQLRVYFKTNAKPIQSITIEYESTEQSVRTA